MCAGCCWNEGRPYLRLLGGPVADPQASRRRLCRPMEALPSSPPCCGRSHGYGNTRGPSRAHVSQNIFYGSAYSVFCNNDASEWLMGVLDPPAHRSLQASASRLVDSVSMYIYSAALNSSGRCDPASQGRALAVFYAFAGMCSVRLCRLVVQQLLSLVLVSQICLVLSTIFAVVQIIMIYEMSDDVELEEFLDLIDQYVSCVKALVDFNAGTFSFPGCFSLQEFCSLPCLSLGDLLTWMIHDPDLLSTPVHVQLRHHELHGEDSVVPRTSDLCNQFGVYQTTKFYRDIENNKLLPNQVKNESKFYIAMLVAPQGGSRLTESACRSWITILGIVLPSSFNTLILIPQYVGNLYKVLLLPLAPALAHLRRRRSFTRSTTSRDWTSRSLPPKSSRLRAQHRLLCERSLPRVGDHAELSSSACRRSCRAELFRVGYGTVTPLGPSVLPPALAHDGQEALRRDLGCSQDGRQNALLHLLVGVVKMHDESAQEVLELRAVVAARHRREKLREGLGSLNPDPVVAVVHPLQQLDVHGSDLRRVSGTGARS
eukprot:318528-Hanusia_phi.AAC.1